MHAFADMGQHAHERIDYDSDVPTRAFSRAGQKSSAMSKDMAATLSFTSLGLRMPVTTLATTGWRKGNCNAV